MFNNIIDETSVFQFQYYQVFYFFPFLYMLSKIYLVFKSIIFHYFLIQETETSKKNLCSYISGSNLQSLENEEISYILRKFSTSSLKSPSFLGESLGFFITFSSDVFISLCFHFFIFSFLLMILGVWLHLFTSLLLHCLSGTSLLCFCTTSATFLRKTERERKRERQRQRQSERDRERWFIGTLSLTWFLPFSPSCFYQGFPWTGSSASKAAALSTVFRNTPAPSVCLNHTAFGKSYYLIGSIYVLGTVTDYLINHLSLILNCLY